MAQSRWGRLIDYNVGPKVAALAVRINPIAARVLFGCETMILRAKFGSCLAALVLIAAGCPSAFGASQCMLAAEQTAFDIRALQSQLMIVALSCGQHNDYNTFVLRHQRDLSDAYQQIASHFTRLYGSAGEEQHDVYITTLANAQSLEGIHQGPLFCRDVKLFVLSALTLQTTDEMSRFVTEKNVTNPYSLAPCEVIPDDTLEKELNDLIRRQHDLVQHRKLADQQRR